MKSLAGWVADFMLALSSLSAIADAHEPLQSAHGVHLCRGRGEGVGLLFRVVVKDTGNGQSGVEWRGRLKRLAYWTDEPPRGLDDKSALDFLNGAYKGLDNLKKVLEERSH